MLNYVWIFLVLAAVVIGGIRLQFKEITDGMIKSAETAVTISIGLIGIMAMWLGVMRIAEKAGIVAAVSRLLKPVLKWLFPDVPEGHPAMCSILMNIAANMLGLSNAATPLGLRAMKDLQSLNPNPSVATNAMCMFLAINTSSVQLIPMTAIAVLASAGSQNPTAIVGTSLIATIFSTIAGIASAKIMEKWRIFRYPTGKVSSNAGDETGSDENNKTNDENGKSKANSCSVNDKDIQKDESPNDYKPFSRWNRTIIFIFLLFFAAIFFLMITREPASGQVGGSPQPSTRFFDSFVLLFEGNTSGFTSILTRVVNAISVLAIPFLFSFFALIALLRRVKVYEEFVAGAKEGFEVAVRIIPYLVAILVAIGMFKSAGGIEILSKLLRPFLNVVGFPADLLPMALMRPLSGSATLGIFTDIVKQFGPDSLIARIAGTIYGSTETTFYVVAIYFGSVNIHKMRHSIAAGLIADLVGIIAAVIVCKIVFAST